MNRPLQRGTAINARRFERWLAPFSNYRTPVTRGLIELWINQFANTDRDLAARILDSVLFINYQAIQNNYRQLLNGIEGWNINPAQRNGRWFFVPFSSSTGESGDSMLHLFRRANGMSNRRYNSLFIHRSDLSLNKLGPNDTVILVDDFSGSGKQACDAWADFFREILIGSPRIILLLIAATNDAVERITNETEMEPHCFRILNNRDNLFNVACNYYNEDEKAQILLYCRRANRQTPQGFGDKGLLVVFSHGCPNNSIPILHSNSRRWAALFPM